MKDFFAFVGVVVLLLALLGTLGFGHVHFSYTVDKLVCVKEK